VLNIVRKKKRKSPAQIPRYIITLHELLAHTPPDHVEKKSLEHARLVT
jgi:hypothetical protein